MTQLTEYRKQYTPELPKALENIHALTVVAQSNLQPIHQEIRNFLPNTADQPLLHFNAGSETNGRKPLRVGVVFSGGQAAGGHNVITGLYDGMKKLNSDSQLIGFLGGPSGIINNKHIELNTSIIDRYRNQGGFDMIGSGRTKIESAEQFAATVATVKALSLDGLVIIGGDDSNTNAALLAEHFLQEGVETKVIGVPKTIDGDLKNSYIETSFGFDTATKTYSEIIGNITRDSLSAAKYYFFIKIMGRSASNVALECALQTHPNLTLIGEEVAAENKTLKQIINDICDIICQRADEDKNYGVILIPEGIIEFIPEIKTLMLELNTALTKLDIINKMSLLNSTEDKITVIGQRLTPNSQLCYRMIPKEIQTQLILDRDPHGNAQVSQIETERLFIQLVERELKKRKEQGAYKGKFNAQPFFCGYEGRSCLPSNFDAQYCNALGYVSALLVENGATGYMSCVQNLAAPVLEWQIAGVPIAPMMRMEERNGALKPVIKKSLVDLEGKPFKEFKEKRDTWVVNDDYLYPGPIQFYGPKQLTDKGPITLNLETIAYLGSPAPYLGSPAP